MKRPETVEKAMKILRNLKKVPKKVGFGVETWVIDDIRSIYFWYPELKNEID